MIEAVEAAAELMSRTSVGAAWDEPSALEGITVGGPAAHLVTPVTYFHSAVDSPIHDQIKQASADESAIGHMAMATNCSDLAEQLRQRLADEPADRLIGALGAHPR